MENPIDEITYNNDAQWSSIHSSYTLTNKTKKKTRGLILIYNSNHIRTGISA